MLPPAPRQKRKREKIVLDEDDWTEKLEAIIQRDYFPDLPKLESQLEWLEVRTLRLLFWARIAVTTAGPSTSLSSLAGSLKLGD